MIHLFRHMDMMSPCEISALSVAIPRSEFLDQCLSAAFLTTASADCYIVEVYNLDNRSPVVMRFVDPLFGESV